MPKTFFKKKKTFLVLIVFLSWMHASSEMVKQAPAEMSEVGGQGDTYPNFEEISEHYFNWAADYTYHIAACPPTPDF